MTVVKYYCRSCGFRGSANNGVDSSNRKHHNSVRGGKFIAKYFVKKVAVFNSISSNKDNVCVKSAEK